jgi:hypothetical protein
VKCSRRKIAIATCSVDLSNVSPDASLQTFGDGEFSQSARVLSEEFRRHGFSGGALLALQVGQHGQEWALQTLQLAFYDAIYDAEQRLDFRANFDSLWDSLPDSLNNPTVDKVPRGSAEGLKCPGSVQRRTICVISSYTRLWHW